MSGALLAAHRADDEVCFGERGVRSRAQLVAFSERIAEVLRELAPEARVVLACRDRYFFSACLLACLSEGRVVLLPDGAHAEVLEALRQRFHVGAVLSDADELGGALDVRQLERPEQRSEATFTCAFGERDTAFVAFTSGSTGEPQAHEKALGQLTIEAANHVVEFALANQRIVSAVPAHHIYGLLFGILVPLLGGGSVVRESALFPEALVELIKRHAAQVLVAVPAHLNVLAQLAHLTLPSLGRVFSSAGPLPAVTATVLRAQGLRVTEILGSTETGGIATRSADGSPFATMRPVRVRIDDDGVLLVSAPWLDPRGPDIVRTAERAELVEGGFRHLGRVDSVVKIGGKRVDLQDIEAQLARAPGVHEARVLAIDSGGTRGVALWAVVAGKNLQAAALRRVLAARFEPVTWPRRFRLVDALPRTATGKVRRADLLALFERADGPGNSEGTVDTAGIDA